MANAQQIHSKRDVTTTPLQALTLYNSDLIFQWSQALAGRVIDEAGDDESAQLDRLYQILFARKPSDAREGRRCTPSSTSIRKTIAEKAQDGKLVARHAGRRRKRSRPIRCAPRPSSISCTRS